MNRLPKLGDIIRLSKSHTFMCVKDPILDEEDAHRGRIMYVFWFKEKSVNRFWFMIDEPETWVLVSEVE